MSNKIWNGIVNDLQNIPKALKSKLKSGDTKKLILMNLPYILVGYVGDLVARIYRLAEGKDISAKSMVMMQELGNLFANPFPSLNPKDLLFGFLCGVALKIFVVQKAKKAKKYRPGVEYGSARWGNEKDIEPYMDSVFENNIPLTQTESLMMSGRPKEPKYARNKNIIVIVPVKQDSL